MDGVAATQEASVARQKVLVIIAFATLYFGWGSTYLAILFALESFPPFFLCGIRFLIAGILLLTWCWIKNHDLPPLKDIVKISIAGILLLSFGTGAVIWAEQYLPSGVVAIIPATMPLWLVILDSRNWRLHFTNKYLMSGLLIGFIGVVLLAGNRIMNQDTTGSMGIISFIVLTGGAISWSAGTLYTKYNEVKGTTLMKTAIQMLVAGVFSLLISISFSEHELITLNISTSALWSLVYLIVIGSIAVYFAFVWLISVQPAPVVSTFVYVNPAVALALGWLFANESVGALKVGALVIILFGVFVVNYSKLNPNKNPKD